jgi:flagellar biosynthetic protein FliR
VDLPIDLTVGQLAGAALVLVRVVALAAVAPVIGPFELAMRWRLALAAALAVLIVPLEAGRLTSPPETLPRFLVLAGGEALVGLMLGLGVRILFNCLQIAGALIGQLSGLQMAEVFSPGVGGNVPVFSQLFLLVGTATFLLIGGHRQMIEALLESYRGLPAGHATISQSAVEGVTALVTQSFLLGLRAAAPAMVALLLATLVVGFVSRTVPQLNVLALGFGTNALVALVAIAVSLGGICWIFQESLEPVLQATLLAAGYES